MWVSSLLLLQPTHSSYFYSHSHCFPVHHTPSLPVLWLVLSPLSSTSVKFGGSSSSPRGMGSVGGRGVYLFFFFWDTRISSPPPFPLVRQQRLGCTLIRRGGQGVRPLPCSCVPCFPNLLYRIPRRHTIISLSLLGHIL